MVEERLHRKLLGAAPTLVRGKVIERILCGQAVAVAVSDLLEHHGAASVENERRWISRLVRRVPAQSVEVGDLIVRVSDKNNIRRQLSLRLKEFLCMLIEVG